MHSERDIISTITDSDVLHVEKKKIIKKHIGTLELDLMQKNQGIR